MTGRLRPASMQHLELPELLPDTLPELLPTPAVDGPSTRQRASASCEVRAPSSTGRSGGGDTALCLNRR